MSRRRPSGSFWPDERQRALLRIVLGPAEQAVARWQALQPLDVTALPIGSFGIMPLLYERLAAVAPDDPQLPLLHGTYRSTWYRDQLLLDRLGRLLPALRDRGVDALLVGGAAAVRRWYPALGSRPVSPVELIVGTQDIPAVRAACAESAWQPAGARQSVARFVDDAGAALVAYAGAPAPLAGPLGPAGGYAALRESASELPELGGLVLDPVDELLRVCAVGARTVLPPSCQWLIDAHQILASADAPAAERVVARAREFRVREPLRATILYLADELGLGASVDTRGDLRERLAHRLAGLPAGRLLGPAQRVAEHLRSYGFRAETRTSEPSSCSPKRRTAAS